MRQASDGARPDAFTLNSVMHGMAGAGEWQRVLAIMDGMQARDGVAPDVVSYNTAMAACNKVRFSMNMNLRSNFVDCVWENLWQWRRYQLTN